MAVVTDVGTERIAIPNMQKQEWLPARTLDYWYIYDKKKTYMKKVSIVDKLVLRFAMCPKVVGTVEYGGEQVQRWFDTYWPISPQRYATEEMVQRVHETYKEWLKDDNGEPLLDAEGKKRFHLKERPYEIGQLIKSKDDYSRFVLDYSGTIPVHIDDSGEPDIRLVPMHKLYKALDECWGEEFKAALDGGTFTIPSLMDIQVEIMTSHGNEKDDGTLWENLDKMRPGKPDQDVPIPEGYVRVKDRKDETPF